MLMEDQSNTYLTAALSRFAISSFATPHKSSPSTTNADPLRFDKDCS